MLPTNSNKSYFPLNLIIPSEYVQKHTVDTATIPITDSLTTKNRLIQAITKTNVNLPLLQAKTEQTALEDCERREQSATICSAASFSRYRVRNPESRLSVIDVVDNLVAQLMVPSNSDIHSVNDLKGKIISCGLPGTASNHLMQQLAKQKHWVQNQDYIVQEQKPNAVQLDRLFDGRISQLDAVLIVDVYPSPVITDLMKDNSQNWRFISINEPIKKEWELKKVNESKLNQQGNPRMINTLVTPMVLVANSTYPAKEIVNFSSHLKNPYVYYNLQQVVNMFKLPIHPTSNTVYQNLGFLGNLTG